MVQIKGKNYKDHCKIQYKEEIMFCTYHTAGSSLRIVKFRQLNNNFNTFNYLFYGQSYIAGAKSEKNTSTITKQPQSLLGIWTMCLQQMQTAQSDLLELRGHRFSPEPITWVKSPSQRKGSCFTRRQTSQAQNNLNLLLHLLEPTDLQQLVWGYMVQACLGTTRWKHPDGQECKSESRLSYRGRETGILMMDGLGC